MSLSEFSEMKKRLHISEIFSKRLTYTCIYIYNCLHIHMYAQTYMYTYIYICTFHSFSVCTSIDTDIHIRINTSIDFDAFLSRPLERVLKFEIYAFSWTSISAPGCSAEVRVSVLSLRNAGP